jgi:CubicO group peptidase (beta-lactamase class C family)
MFSYNNAAFAVAGRLAEVVRGQPFRTLLAERIAGPLGLESVSPSPYEAILWRAAVGHIPIGPEGAEVPTPQWALAPATAPAGAMLAMTATDLVGFGRAHLGDGLGANGIRILSAESARAMRAPQAELPAINGVPSARGLGFGLTTSADPLVAGHNGGTIGQTSFFRIVPGHDLAIALLTNGGDPIPLYQAAVEQTITELTGAQFPAPPAPPAEPYPVNPAGWLGTYANTVTQVELAQAADGSLIVTLTPKGIEAEIGGQVESAAAVGYDERSLITAEPFHGLHATLTFLGDDGQGRTPYLYVGGRILPRL